jgi:hypothetical protein
MNRSRRNERKIATQFVLTCGWSLEDRAAGKSLNLRAIATN